MSEDIFSLDPNKILERNLDESETLEYKHKRAKKQSLAKELTAFANTNGGRIFYGVYEGGGDIIELQNVTGFSGLEEGISQVLAMRTDPTISVDMNKIDHKGNTIVELSVEHQGVLHTYRLENNKPYVPVRVGTTTDFLSGSAIREFYRSSFEDRNRNSSISELRDEIRRTAHRVVYTFEESDFSEINERVSFALIVKEVVEKLENTLAEPHRDLEEETKERIRGVIRAGQNLSERQTSADYPGVYSLNDPPTRKDYIGDSPEEVERKYRKAALKAKESAITLEQHLT